MQLFDKYGVPSEPDFVSIDIDSIDWWIFRSLIKGGYRPRVVTVEYNINMPIDAVLVQSLVAGKWDYAFGASLKAVATVAEEVGYTLVHVVRPRRCPGPERPLARCRRPSPGSLGHLLHQPDRSRASHSRARGCLDGLQYLPVVGGGCSVSKSGCRALPGSAAVPDDPPNDEMVGDHKYPNK